MASHAVGWQGNQQQATRTHIRQVFGKAPARPQLAGRAPVKLLFSIALQQQSGFANCENQGWGLWPRRRGLLPAAQRQPARHLLQPPQSLAPTAFSPSSPTYRSVRFRNAPSAAQASGRGPAIQNGATATAAGQFALVAVPQGGSRALGARVASHGGSRTAAASAPGRESVCKSMAGRAQLSTAPVFSTRIAT